MTAPSLLEVALVSAAVAAVVAAFGIAALRLVRRRPLATSVLVVALVSGAAVLAAALAGSAAMFLTEADLAAAVVTVAVAGLAGVPVALVLSRWLAADSSALQAAAGAVGREHRPGRPPPPEPLSAELRALGAELAAAQTRLADARVRERGLEASRRELVAWVSHDLRTPLSGIRAMAEALEDGVVDAPADVAAYHAGIRREADRLAAMVDDLFELSRINAGALRLTLQRVSVADLVTEALASTGPVARAKGVRLQVTAAEGLPVDVDVPRLGRALADLVTNAVRHTPGDGTVEVVGAADGASVYVAVSDGCGGIPAADLPRLFDVAFRGAAARTPHTAVGGGLGLAIARGIVEAHSGRIEVANVGRGCRFVVRLPLARPA